MHDAIVGSAVYKENERKVCEEMKKRILTAAVCVPLAVAVLSFCPVWVTRLAVAFFCCVGMLEMLSALKLNHHRLLTAVAVVFAAVVPSLDQLGGTTAILTAVAIYALLLTVVQLLFNQTLKVERLMFFGTASVMTIVPLGMLAHLCAIPDHGRFYIYFALIIAWLADIGAYFVGTFLGKHKLCPNISPKKTVEGLIGGLISAALFSMVGAWVYQLVALDALGLQINFWAVALTAMVLSPLSVIGDLICSVIKRQTGIKDFGNLFPGHGGVLDRFDSLIFVAPLLYVATMFIPFVSSAYL